MEFEIKTKFSTSKNDKLIKAYIDAKINGGYGRIVYERIISSLNTAKKKVVNLHKVDKFFSKDFDKITEDENLKFRNALNSDKICCNRSKIEWNKNKNGKMDFKTNVIDTNKPLSYRTKMDIKINWNEFWIFLTEYIYQTEKKELKNIMRYFKIQQPSDFQQIKVDFIDDDDIQTLLNNIKNINFKALVQLGLMSGGRPCELLNIKYGKNNNLYKNKDGKWVIHLPKVKKVSYAKFPFVIDMYEDELYPYFDNLKMKEGDLVFTTTDKTFRKLMRHYTEKYIGKHYSPKILRKTARMLRTNAGYSTDLINKLMGHAPGSKVQGHYVNYSGIKNDFEANDRLKGQQYPGLKRDYDKMKLEMQAQREQVNQIMELLTQKNKKNLTKLINEIRN